VPDEARAFQPRTHLRALVEERLGSGAVILHGAAGSGKSQLAAACAREHAARGTPVVWVDLSTAHDLLGRRTARISGLGSREERTSGARRPYLLVLDDVTDPEAAARALRSCGTDWVIVTTRDRRCVPLGQAVEVGEYTYQEALAYLRDTAGDGREEAAQGLLPLMGRLPLTLALAAKSIGHSFQDTFSVLYGASGPGRGSPLSAVVRLLLRGLSTKQVRLLEELALLARRGLPDRMLIAEGERAAFEALAETSLVVLRDGWVRFSSTVVQEAVRHRASGAVWETMANAIRRCELIYDIEAPDAWRELEFLDVLAEHATALLEYAVRLTGRDDDDLHRLQIVLADLLNLHDHALGLINTLRDFSRATSLARHVLDHATPLLPPDHPALTRVRGHLATACGPTGREEEAIALFEGILDTRLRTLNSDHPDTQDARDGLALAYLAAERPWDAIDLQEQLLTDRRLTLGPGHGKTLMAYNNLALSYLRADRAEEAVTLLETAAETAGDSHRTTLVTLGNLALAYARLDRADEAMELHRLVLSRRTRTLGGDHPDTLAAQHHLAVLHQRRGRLPAAITLLREVLATREDVLGAGHPDTLASRAALVSAHEEAGDLETAVEVCRQGVERLRILLDDQAGRRLLPQARAWERLAALHAARGDAAARDAALSEVAAIADRMARDGDAAGAAKVTARAGQLRRAPAAADRAAWRPPGELDPDLDEVFSALSKLDPTGLRAARVLRHSFDEIYDGAHTGRFRWDQLTRTEKAGMAARVAIGLGHEFGFPGGAGQEVEIDGVAAGYAFSSSGKGWTFAQNEIGAVRVLLWADDERSLWGMGVLRVQPRLLAAAGAARRGGHRLNPLGNASVRWIHNHAPLPRNVLLSLPAEDTEAIFRESSAAGRLSELFRRAQGQVVGASAVAAVAMQENAMTRVREVRASLGLEGIVVLGGHHEHRRIAEALTLPVPGQGELVSIRLARRGPRHHGAPRVEIRGEPWVIAQEGDPVGLAPLLP
jgi:tetratricopeptide (TPR) repeat protein